MNNLRKIHSFLDKHEWIDMVLLGGMPPAGASFHAAYVVCTCACGCWSHRPSDDTSTIIEIITATDSSAINAVLRALTKNQKLYYKFSDFLNSIKYSRQYTNNTVYGSWQAELLPGISRLPVNRGVQKLGQK